MMRKSIFPYETSMLFLLVLCSGYKFSEGIRCWTCENAMSNDDCLARGRSVDCYSSGMGCSSEVRYHAGFVFKIQIRKGCKQMLACGSDKSQNGHGWFPVQCNPKFPDSICRCCCQRDNCNKNLIGCEPPQPDCRRLVTPRNGYKICNNEDHPTSLRSICSFFCNDGYELLGYYRTECVKTQSGKATWTDKEPRCVTKTCKPRFQNTPSRRVDCTNGNNAGSVCSFTCAKGHVMNGEPKSTCLISKNWDYPPPDCVKITCPPPSVPSAHSEISCTRGEELGSICRYSCELGYIMDSDGLRECVLSSTPESSFGTWSGTVPQCRGITCDPKQSNPTNGIVTCTDMDFIGSTCVFECKDDYILEGSDSMSCLWDKTLEKGYWNAETPICSPTKCSNLERNMTNGRIICSTGNNVGSMCVISCNVGAYIYTPTDPDVTMYSWISSCFYGGRWSREEDVTCRDISCFPDVSSSGITNGLVRCSDEDRYGSECGFSCDEGYELYGRRRIVCEDAVASQQKGKWDSDIPRCVKIGCSVITTANMGMKMSCTDRFQIGSVCTFECKSGYFMEIEPFILHPPNKHTIECMDDNSWSAVSPVCKEIRCFPQIMKLENGESRCSNSNRFKSKCSFSCDVAYGLKGASKLSCLEDTESYGSGVWSQSRPNCVRNGCAPIFTAPRNGKMTCTRRNLFRSACTFTCDKGYYMKSSDNYLIQSNSHSSRCSTSGDWSNIPPTCHPISCKPIDKVVQNGNVTCTDAENYNSECLYMCNDGYEVNSKFDTTVCTDQLTSDAFGIWSQTDVECKRATCPKRQRAPDGGKVACTAGNGVNSVCLFSCYNGYYLNSSMGPISSNTFEIKCERNKKWTAAAPQCLPVTCPSRTLPNGDVTCTKDNQQSSSCNFYCFSGYMLIGDNSTVCLGNARKVAKWSKEWPSCVELECETKHTKSPKNGYVLCSDGAKLRSTCEFICSPGYSLVGEEYIVCEEKSSSHAEWSSAPPRCARRRA